MTSYQWLFVPLLITVPSLTTVAIFTAADKKATTIPAFFLLAVVVAGMLFGWYGTAMYLILEEAIYGRSELFSSPIVKGAGIFISWASSLPLAYLFKRNIETLRKGTAIDRALLTFILFYGVHFIALCVFVIIKGGFAVL